MLAGYADMQLRTCFLIVLTASFPFLAIILLFNYFSFRRSFDALPPLQADISGASTIGPSGYVGTKEVRDGSISLLGLQ